MTDTDVKPRRGEQTRKELLDLAEIAIMAADTARRFIEDPRVAMISFSNFGSARTPRRTRSGGPPSSSPRGGPTS